jgi:hypothetical protein
LRRVTARQLAAIEQCFNKIAGSWGKLVQPCFFLGPKQDARAKPFRLHQPFHEGDLINTGFEKEAREGRECFLAQIAAPVEIVATGKITFSEVRFVSRFVAREAARDRPYRASVERIQQHRVRHKSRDAPIAVKERVYPQQSMMRCRRGEDCISLADTPIDFLEMGKEARYRTRTDGNVSANAHVAMAQLAGNDAQTFMRVGLFDPEHVLGQRLAKTPMNVADAFCRHGVAVQTATIDPTLDGDMRLRLKLEIALFRISAVVVLERPLDIDRVRVVAFDEIAVVAIHRSDEIGERPDDAGWKATAKARRLGGEIDRKVSKRPPMVRLLVDEQGLHRGHQFMTIGSLRDVRFYVLFVSYHNAIYIIILVENHQRIFVCECPHTSPSNISLLSRAQSIGSMPRCLRPQQGYSYPRAEDAEIRGCILHMERGDSSCA